jgi:hypothetical protein
MGVKYNKSEEPMVISKYSMDKMLKLDDPARAIALYSFLYYTAKWQGTDQPKASVDYCAKALNIGVNTVRKIKGQLESIGLIEDVKRVDEQTKKVVGWYVKVNFVWQKNPPSRIDEGGHKNHPHGFPQGGKKDPNALSTGKLNALSTDINTPPTPPGGKSEAGSNSYAKKTETVQELLAQLSEMRREIFETWLAYKAEKRQGYEPTGLRALIKQFAELPNGELRKWVEHSMSMNYAGIYKPKEDVAPAKPKWDGGIG